MAKQKFITALGDIFKKRSPEILLGIGIAGGFTTVILAVTATPKAMRLIEEARIKREKETEEDEVKELTKAEIVKAAWKVYIPAALSGICSVVCLVCAHSVNARRNAALAAACTLSETALKEYQAKVVETIGEKKEGQIRDAINQDHIAANPVSSREVFVTPAGETLCYDHWSGRYFKSDVETLRKAVNEVNRRMLDEIYISLNDLYDEYHLPSVKIGDELGWNVNRTGFVDLRLGAQLAENNVPCIVLDYVNPPVHDFDRG